MNIIGNVFLVIVLILVIYNIVSCVRIVPQAQAYVILARITARGPWDCILRYRLLTGWRERCS